MKGTFINEHIQPRDFTPELLQSLTIDTLRFPMAILVIFIHMDPNVTSIINDSFDCLSAHGVCNLIEILISQVISRIAVPTFFFISGFLFFLNFQKWSWEGYKNKIRSRAKTLLIPYLLWNAIPFVLTVLAMLSSVILKGQPISEVQNFITEKGWHIFYDCNEISSGENWLGMNMKMTGPHNLPLWFLRDLIVVSILTPLIYFGVKKVKIAIIPILFLAYISNIWISLPGFSVTAFFYFSIGAYFALNNINIIQFANKHKLSLVSTCMIFLIGATIFYGTNTTYSQIIKSVFICSGIFTAFIIAENLVICYKATPNKLLISSCFFIYALHAVGLPIIHTPLLFVNRLLHNIISGTTYFEEIVCYLIAPFVTAILCILLYAVAKHLFPKTTNLFSGNK